MRYEKQIGEKMLQYFVEGDAFPTFVKFARICGITPSDLEKWRKTSKHFREVYEQCSTILCDRVADGALHRTLDPSFSKFYLASQYGWGETPKGTRESFHLKVTVGDGETTSSECTGERAEAESEGGASALRAEGKTARGGRGPSRTGKEE